jgi:diketogulonate reductase-like aldo/keto reductase
MNIDKKLKLNNDLTIPQLGFGTYQMHETAEAEPAILAALEVGYRHIDTAQMYDNEAAIGRAIKKSGIHRAEIFVTTKFYAGKSPKEELAKSLERLGLEYIDLYLLHWPLSNRLELWKEFIEVQAQGLAKSIGVCNFTINHLKELLENSEYVPQVNQVEFSPFLYQKELLEFCSGKNIVLEAYSPLTRGHQLDNPTLIPIAQAHGKTSAQILIRWALQHGVVPLPKSSKPSRIKQNAQVFDFELNEDEMRQLDGLNIDKHYCWDPNGQA